MRKKNVVVLVALAIIFFAGVTALVSEYQTPSTYNENEVNGIADIIVDSTLDQTNALNVVSAVVFDFRGYDTMGEAFILITAISGSMAILRNAKKKGEEEHGE